MNEINLDALKRPLSVERGLTAAANQKSDEVRNASAESDSVEFSQLPDFSIVDKTVEQEFASRRSSLQNAVESELYPPLETIDKLAAMLAIDLNPDKK